MRQVTQLENEARRKLDAAVEQLSEIMAAGDVTPEVVAQYYALSPVTIEELAKVADWMEDLARLEEHNNPVRAATLHKQARFMRECVAAVEAMGA